MNESFSLPVSYHGKDLAFEATLQSWAYGYRFLVMVGEVEVVFERDDEGNYRAIIPQGSAGKLPEKGLLEAIVQTIQSL